MKLTSYLAERAEKYSTIGCFLFVFALLFYFLHPLLRPEIFVGWDTPAHFFLLEETVENIKNSHIISYSESWFGGFPLFSLYGPFLYVLMSLVYFLSFGIIPLELVFNIFLFTIPFYCVFSLWYAADAWYGKIAGRAAILLSLLFLFPNSHNTHFGYGIQAVYHDGLFNQVFALSTIFLFFAVLQKHVTEHYTSWIFPAILCMAIITSHTLSLVFFLLLLIFYLLDKKYNWRRTLKVCLLGAVFSSWWLFYFFSHLRYSTSSAMGKMTSDPLLLLFPGLEKFLSLLFQPALWDISLFFQSGILLFLGTAIGIFISLQYRYYALAYAWIVLLLFLPRDYLLNIEFPLSLHYYRFVPYIFVLEILLVAAAIQYIWTTKMHSFVRYAWIGIACVMLTSIIWYEVLPNASTKNTKKIQSFVEYPWHQDAQKVIQHFQKVSKPQKIFIETQSEFQKKLGSVHYFHAFLPSKTDHTLTSGLLAESSLTHAFLNNSFQNLGKPFTWGRSKLLHNAIFQNQSSDFYLQRLLDSGITSFVVSSEKAHSYLLPYTKKNILVLSYSVGNFQVFDVISPISHITEDTKDVWLYIDAGGQDFLQASEMYYASSAYGKIHLVHTKKNPLDLPIYEQKRFQGIFISYHPAQKIDQVSIKEFAKIFPKILIHSGSQIQDMPPGVLQINDLQEAFIEISPDPDLDQTPLIFYKKAKTFFLSSDKHITMRSSYAPSIVSNKKYQTIYWEAPSYIFLFGDGKSEISLE